MTGYLFSLVLRYSQTTTSHYHRLLCMSTHGYTERDAVPNAMWLHVPRPCSALSRMSMRGN